MGHVEADLRKYEREQDRNALRAEEMLPVVMEALNDAIRTPSPARLAFIEWLVDDHPRVFVDEIMRARPCNAQIPHPGEDTHGEVIDRYIDRFVVQQFVEYSWREVAALYGLHCE